MCTLPLFKIVSSGMCFSPLFLLQSFWAFCLFSLIASKFGSDGFTNYIINPANTGKSQNYTTSQTFPIPDRLIYQCRSALLCPDKRLPLCVHRVSALWFFWCPVSWADVCGHSLLQPKKKIPWWFFGQNYLPTRFVNFPSNVHFFRQYVKMIYNMLKLFSRSHCS